MRTSHISRAPQPRVLNVVTVLNNRGLENCNFKTQTGKASVVLQTSWNPSRVCSSSHVCCLCALFFSLTFFFPFLDAYSTHTHLCLLCLARALSLLLHGAHSPGQSSLLSPFRCCCVCLCGRVRPLYHLHRKGEVPMQPGWLNALYSHQTVLLCCSPKTKDWKSPFHRLAILLLTFSLISLRQKRKRRMRKEILRNN